MALEGDDDEFFDAQIDHQELRKAISNIIEGIVKSSSEEKKALLSKISNTVDEIDIYELKLVISSQGLEKATNKELFIKLIEEALKGLTSENVDSKIIEEALKSVNQQAISNVINNNKGPLDNLVNYFKSASANKKIGIASTGIVLGVAFSPLIVLATLIALVAIGARYVGIGIGKAGEKIKEGAIEAGKAVKSSYKDLIDKLPKVQARENNFSRLRTNMLETIANISLKDNEGVDAKKGLDDGKKILEMLQNEGQRSAIQELVKNGTIENFSEDDMSRLMNKGLSTHLADMERSKDTEESKKKGFHILMGEFQSAIMAIGDGKIEDVEQKINDKVNQMKPDSHLGISSAARVSEGGITGPNI